MTTSRVLLFRPYPLKAGDKIHIEEGPRSGDWEVLAASEKTLTLRCPISQRQFERALPHVMKMRHSVVKSHSIKRLFKQVRGFRGVRVIPPGGGTSAGGSTTTASNPGPSQEEV